jgi:hypothetical protein
MVNGISTTYPDENHLNWLCETNSGTEDLNLQHHRQKQHCTFRTPLSGNDTDSG